MATLTDDRIDLAEEKISFKRVKIKAKNRGLVMARMGPTLKEIILRRYGKGYLFPELAAMHEKDRSTYFRRRCQRLGLPDDLVLHCYRHAVIQRAEACDFEERLAMRLVGHNQKSTHASYARTANVAVPSLEEKEIEFRSKTAKSFRLIQKI